jgi:hypothetical protein
MGPSFDDVLDYWRPNPDEPGDPGITLADLRRDPTLADVDDAGGPSPEWESRWKR